MEDRKMATRTYQRDLGNGLHIMAEIPPCVFMYHNHPLQVFFHLMRGDRNLTPFGASVAVKDRSITGSNYTDADVLRLLSGVTVKPCTRCGEPALDPETCQCHRAGLCHACHASDCDKQMAKDVEADQRSIGRRDKKMKRNGMQFRVTAWVHLSAGDDHQVDLYFASHPDKKTIWIKLKKLGSTILDDYAVVEL
jgi:hypothetical protein